MVATLALAFAGGLVSCASTCFLPLIPAYITYMGGRAVALPDQNALRQQLRVLGNALLFIAGFATVFVAFGAAAGLIGADLIAYRPLLLRVAGVALVVMGVVLLGGLPWLLRQFRVEVAHRLPRPPWASYVVGLAFAIGLTPCIGPILTAILILAANSATAPKGALLLAAYSAGMGLPLLVAAGLVGQLTRLIRKAYAFTRVVNAVAAVVMIAMGLLIFTNQLTILNSYLPYFAVTPGFESAFQASTAEDKPGIPRTGGVIRAGTVAPDSCAEVHVQVVWDPVWTRARIREESRETMRRLGIVFLACFFGAPLAAAPPPGRDDAARSGRTDSRRVVR